VNCHKASKIARKIGTLGGSMAALLGGLAEFERELTRARAREGSNGQRRGREVSRKSGNLDGRMVRPCCQRRVCVV
jgi:DNA invertase Pin-like site-specific DNA recombinase